MTNLAMEKGNLTDRKVVELSQQLDTFLLQLQRLKEPSYVKLPAKKIPA
jgi:hypothetical protein